MPKDFQPTDEQVTSVVDRMLIAHHPEDFCQDGKCLKVDTIFVVAVNGEDGTNDANLIVEYGTARNSKIVIRNLLQRREGSGDVLIIINRKWWEDADMRSRDAEINTCLLSIEAVRDSEGNLKHDEALRLVVKKRKPDVIIPIFDKAISIHGEASQSWKDVKDQIIDGRGQLLFGWDDDNTPSTTSPSELERAAMSSLKGAVRDDETVVIPTVPDKDPDMVRPPVVAQATENPKRKTKRGSKAIESITGETPEDIAARTKAWNDRQRGTMNMAN